jgi:ABC-type amino acid transport substrate-binding protein
MRLKLILAATFAALTACSPGVADPPPPAAPVAPSPLAIAPAPTPPVTPTPAPLTPPEPRLNVRVLADPAPPFTYWAPDGSVIRNHPTVPGIWVAQSDGRQSGVYYFGDRCKASERQGLVGQPVQSLPKPTPADWRVSCAQCPVTDDLRRDRLNVVFDANDIITRVSCG